MIDLDKQFAELADTSAEDSTCDFVIDEDLRIIAIPERGVVLGVEGDKDANRIRFRMNKTWRGYDMSKFDLRINYQNANGDKNYYTVTSKHTEGNAVVFDWIVAADAVAYKGDVFFIVVGLITTGGMVNCAFHTTLGKAKCLEGLVVDTKTDISEIRDFMATLKAEVEAYGQTFANAAAASAKVAKTSETNASTSASTAKTSETNAKGSETKSGEYLQAIKEYFEQVRTITLGAQGWYETSDALTAAVPVGENGWWAVVGTTDSIWVWDRDTNAWRDSMVTVNMSDYYTRTQVDEKLTDKANKTADDLNTMINALTTGASTPTDADYYVSQYVGGGTSTTTFHRRPMSTLWAYIKSKAESVFAAKEAVDAMLAEIQAQIAKAGAPTERLAFVTQISAGKWGWNNTISCEATIPEGMDFIRITPENFNSPDVLQFSPDKDLSLTSSNSKAVLNICGTGIDPLSFKYTASNRKIKITVQDANIGTTCIQGYKYGAAATPCIVWTEGDGTSAKDHNIDYIEIKERWNSGDSSNTNTKEAVARVVKGSTYTTEGGATVTFASDGTVTAKDCSGTLVGYRYMTLTEVSEQLASTQSALADADALNLDQDYRLTLLELGVTDDETTETA